jgi:Type III secretion system YscX (type_III_YscX)
MATQINNPASLNLLHGLLPSDGMPVADSTLPSGSIKAAQTSISYVAHVDLIYEKHGLKNIVNEWSKPQITNTELLEPAKFRNTLIGIREDLKRLMAKASPTEQTDLKRLLNLLNDDISLRELAQFMYMSLHQG